MLVAALALVLALVAAARADEPVYERTEQQQAHAVKRLCDRLGGTFIPGLYGGRCENASPPQPRTGPPAAPNLMEAPPGWRSGPPPQPGIPPPGRLPAAPYGPPK